MPSWTLVEVHAQFVNGRKPHHALGHLGLDRTVGIQGIGHSIDDARFEDRHLRLLHHWSSVVCAGCGGARFGEGRWRPATAPLRRQIGAPRAFRFGPRVVECGWRRLARFGRRFSGRKRTNIDRGWIGGSRLGAVTFLPRRRGKQQIAPRLDGRCGLHCLRRRRRIDAYALARGTLVMPRRRRG